MACHFDERQRGEIFPWRRRFLASLEMTPAQPGNPHVISTSASAEQIARFARNDTRATRQPTCHFDERQRGEILKACPFDER